MENFIIWLAIPIGIAIILIGLNYFFTQKKSTTVNQVSQNNSPTSSPKKTKWLGKIGGAIGVLILTLVLAFIVSFVWNWTSNLFEKKVQPAKSTKVLYHDVPTTGIPIYLHPGWKAFPSGKVKIITPKKNSFTYNPASNENYYPGYLSEGWYYFYSIENQGIKMKVEDTF